MVRAFAGSSSRCCGAPAKPTQRAPPRLPCRSRSNGVWVGRTASRRSALEGESQLSKRFLSRTARQWGARGKQGDAFQLTTDTIVPAARSSLPRRGGSYVSASVLPDSDAVPFLLIVDPVSVVNFSQRSQAPLAILLVVPAGKRFFIEARRSGENSDTRPLPIL